MANDVNAQTCEGDPRHICAEGRLGCAGFQSGARSNGRQLPFLAGEPRHCNCGSQQNSNSDQAPLRFAISKKIQNGSQHHESRQREKENSRNPSCPCLVEFEPKHQNTTAAESSSIKLSPPKAMRS